MKKMMRISFEIDMVQLLTAMTGSSSMKIDVFDGERPAKLNGHQHSIKAISKPAKKKGVKKRTVTKNKQGKRPTRDLILRHMITKDEPIQLKELNDIALKNGNTKSATSVGLDYMQKRKWVKRTGPGMWQVTDLGKQQINQESK